MNETIRLTVILDETKQTQIYWDLPRDTGIALLPLLRAQLGPAKIPAKEED